jgi:hypothetical protein
MLGYVSLQIRVVKIICTQVGPIVSGNTWMIDAYHLKLMLAKPLGNFRKYFCLPHLIDNLQMLKILWLASYDDRIFIPSKF